jgi:hypothetical protein
MALASAEITLPAQPRSDVHLKAMESQMATRLAFVSTYQGATDYRVSGASSIAGRRIRVFSLTSDAYVKASQQTPAEHHAELEQLAGCVVGPDCSLPVPLCVLDAARKRHAQHRDALATLGIDTSNVSETLSACRWTPGQGYIRVPDRACASATPAIAA